uniref:hypothetical protein n=1 Tax=Paludisphaera rhizosphaerae TaxID=2711216 RepID=UPI001981D2BA
QSPPRSVEKVMSHPISYESKTPEGWMYSLTMPESVAGNPALEQYLESRRRQFRRRFPNPEELPKESIEVFSQCGFVVRVYPDPADSPFKPGITPDQWAANVETGFSRFHKMAEEAFRVDSPISLVSKSH